MRKLAIIPARGGSQRIPDKNIKQFYGKPIIAYSIEVAKASGLFDEIMVSTDNERIAEIAVKYGASVPFLRSEKNSDSYATTLSVILEVLNQYQELGQSFDYTCCIYATAPLIQSNHLKEGFDKLTDKNFSTVFPVVSFGYPIWRGLSIDEEQRAQMIWPEYQSSRSQDLRQVYHDAGQWYWVDPKKISDTIFSDNSGVIVLAENEIQDIDNIEDWELLKVKYQFKNENFDKI